MLSLMDAILEIPMTEVLEKIALDQETKSVLSGAGGRLEPIYNLMLAQESGDWGKAKAAAAHLHIVDSEAGEMWRQAVLRARKVSKREPEVMRC